MDTREVYMNLYKDMIQLMRNIDIIIVELQKTSNFAKRTVIINDSLGFCGNFNNYKEKLLEKKNIIRNRIIPQIQAEISKG